MAEHMTKSDPSADRTATAPADRAISRGPSRRGSWAARVAGSLMTGVVVLAALGIGIGIGRSLLAPDGNGRGGEAAGTSPGELGETVWTCSMHPQIRQPNPGDCPLCGMDLIPDTDDGGQEAEGLREVSISREARELLDLKVQPVERRYVTATVRMVGKVDFDETRVGYITAYVPGRLDRLFVDYTGVEVKEGDHMVSIYSPELYSAQAELIRARQAVQQRRSTTGALGAERLLQSAREKLRLWGLQEDQIREIEDQEEPSENLTIYAPMSGIVIQKNAQEGMYVDTGTRIYTISDLSRLWVKLDAYESDLPWLRYGQEVEFTSEAYPGEVFTGTVAFIDPVLNAQTRTVKVRVNVSNPSGRLKPDMFVRAVVRAQVATAGRVMDPDLVGKWICRMHPSVVKETAGDCDICEMPLMRTESLGYVSAASAADESAEPLVVPASAVLRTGTRAVVYVERPDAERPTYEGREIVLGPRAGDSYIVRAGLEEGERVVTQGNFKLDSALQISAKPSMMNPEGGLEEAMEMALNASPSITRQIARVQEAANRVDEARRSGDREATREALLRFEDAVASVDASALQGRAAMAWKELAMQLRNDAVEGRWASSPGREGEAVDRLLADFGRLRAAFGLPDDPAALLASAALDVPPTFRDQLGSLWESYGEAQDALVADKPEAALAAAEEAGEALAGIEDDALEGEARALWESAHDDLRAALNRMGEAEDLSGLRSAFGRWSNAFRPVVSSIGLGEPGGTVVAHSCSMALDNAGAFWLQAGEEVRNPYMGQKMPRCTTGVEVVWDGPPPPPAFPSDPSSITDAFRRQLFGLWDAYLDVQDALASDDLEASRRAAEGLDDALAAIDASALEGEAIGAWDRERENLRTAIDRMTGADGIEPIRAGFALVSEEMPVLFEAYRPSVGGPVYRMHCPMAFDGRGAAWLQSSEEVRNPYFGSAMIRCATEIEQIADADREGHDHD